MTANPLAGLCATDLIAAATKARVRAVATSAHSTHPPQTCSCGVLGDQHQHGLAKGSPFAVMISPKASPLQNWAAKLWLARRRSDGR